MGRFNWVAATGLAVIMVSFSLGCIPPPRVRANVVAPRVRVTAPAPAPTATVRVATPVATATVSAAPLAVGGAVANGAITYPGQRVRYPLTITYPRTLNIYVNGHGLDPTVALYDAYGNQVAFNDDGGSGLDSQLVRTVAPGNYVVEVSGYQSSTGSYTVTVQ